MNAGEHSRAFAAALDGANGSSPLEAAELLGLEHEYRVLRPDGQLDFRSLIHHLDLGQSHLDPGDPYAYRLASGGALTCDGLEAEIAIPPVERRPGFEAAMVAHARTQREHLGRLLLPGAHLEGYSTHLSVSMPPDISETVARMYTRTFAPAMMLLLDRATSPGLLVRPRPGRTELCGDFLEGVRLGAAAIFAAGSVLACARAVQGDPAARQRLPPRIALHVEPAIERYGWYVDRRAAGEDLYRRGRRTRLSLKGGGSITAQDHLEAAWHAALAALGQRWDGCTLVDQLIAGSLPLSLERPTLSLEPSSARENPPASVYGSLLEPRARPGFDLAPVMVTWEMVVFVLVDRRRPRRAFACIPRDRLALFLQRLETGRLDALFADFLARPARRYRLDRHENAVHPGLYDVLGSRRRLLSAERAQPRVRMTIMRSTQRLADAMRSLLAPAFHSDFTGGF